MIDRDVTDSHGVPASGNADAPTELTAPDALLTVRGLRTSFYTHGGVIRAVDGVDFSIPRAGTLGVVGESGSGKSVTALSIMRLVERPGRVESDSSMLFDGRELVTLPSDEMAEIRGNEISMIFQEPMTSLNPVFTVGEQIAEAVRLHHRGIDRREADERAIEMMRLVGIPSPEKRARDYPHHLSGGMRQRVMIGMALSCSPKLLIADEPTTALDVTVQAQILELMKDLRERLGMAILLITHDLGVVAEMADDVAVMYGGKVVERGPVADIFARPQHPYTEALLKSIPLLGMRSTTPLKTVRGMVPSPLDWPRGCRFAPRCDHVFDRCRTDLPPLFPVATQESACWLCESGPRPATVPSAEVVGVPAAAAAAGAGEPDILLSTRRLKKHFPIKKGALRRASGALQAVDGVDLDIRRGETLGLVGESGCGKSTLARTLLRLIEPTEGEIEFDGVDVLGVPARSMKDLRQHMQIVFQDAVGSLDPRMTVGDLVAEGLTIHGVTDRKGRKPAVQEILARVGLPPEAADRYPHQFSGGQRQRIGLARALVLRPKLIVADEPVSALDVSIQSQVLNLLVALKKEFDLTYVFVAHDLAVVGYISDRVAVMYLGRIVEIAPSDELFARPLHPYTVALLSANPEPAPGRKSNRIVLKGDVPSPIDPPSGCRFHTRCPIAQPICSEVDPALADHGGDHRAACHFPGTLIPEAADASAA
jgi:peptide/nickel transport system ATP-binding protein